VTAVVVRSWGSGSGSLVWRHLNENWSSYGSIPIAIDYTSLHEVNSFTLADLETIGADVVIVSNPSGGTQQWTPPEVAALETYASAGHNLVGTYLLLVWQGGGATDNRILAPPWGLRSDLAYLGHVDASDSPLLEPGHCLFRNIASPLDLGGYPYAQTPDDLMWDESDLAGASFLARSDDRTTVVTTYDAGGYDAHYISSMPEYQDGSELDATQWLYNAISCIEGTTPVSSTTWGRLKATFNQSGR
jgi:hypothetical protein